MVTDQYVSDAVERLTYPRLNPSFIPVLLNEDTVHLRAGPWDGPVKTIRDPEKGGQLGSLFDALDGRTHVVDLLDAIAPEQQSDVAELLLELHDSAIIYDDQNRTETWPHLSIKPDFRNDPEPLDNHSVLIITVGDIGRQVSEDLVSFGLNDVQVASPSWTEEVENDPGTPSIDLNDHSLDELLTSVSFVVLCADRPCRDLFQRVNQAAIESGTPWVSGQVLGCNGVVGPAVFPGETACYACFERRLLSNVPNPEACKRYLESGPNTSKTTDYSLARTVAGYLGMDVLHLLAFGSGYTAGRILTIDATTLTFGADDVLRVPRCEACSDHGSASRTQFLTLEDVVNICENVE